jgi:hypothetical protein
VYRGNLNFASQRRFRRNAEDLRCISRGALTYINQSTPGWMKNRSSNTMLSSRLNRPLVTLGFSSLPNPLAGSEHVPRTILALPLPQLCGVSPQSFNGCVEDVSCPIQAGTSQRPFTRPHRTARYRTIRDGVNVPALLLSFPDVTSSSPVRPLLPPHRVMSHRGTIAEENPLLNSTTSFPVALT